MSFSVTELATLVFKAGSDLEGDTPEAKAWKETLVTVSQQEGYQRSYWGQQLEDPTVVKLLIDWDSLASHKQFIASPAYSPFVSNISPFTTKIYLHHIRTQPSPPLALGTFPITEVVTFFSVESIPSFTSAVDQFLTSITAEGKPDGFVGSVYGEVVEEIAKGGGEEGKAAAVGLFIGWVSREKHEEFRGTETFKKYVGLLREGLGGSELVHVAFRKND